MRRRYKVSLAAACRAKRKRREASPAPVTEADDGDASDEWHNIEEDEYQQEEGEDDVRHGR